MILLAEDPSGNPSKLCIFCAPGDDLQRFLEEVDTLELVENNHSENSASAMDEEQESDEGCGYSII